MAHRVYSSSSGAFMDTAQGSRDASRERGASNNPADNNITDQLRELVKNMQSNEKPSAEQMDNVFKSMMREKSPPQRYDERRR